MRGEIIERGYQSPTPRNPAVTRAYAVHTRRTIASSSSTASSRRSLTHHVGELVLRRRARRTATRRRALDLLGVVGAAPDQARRAAPRRDGGAMKICTASGIASRTWRAPCTSISSTTGRPAGGAALELGAQRAVAAARVRRRARRTRPASTRRVELRVAEEVVVDAVGLARARRARGRRDAESSSSGMRSRSARISVPLPTPEGPVMTKTRATRGRSAPSGGASRRARLRWRSERPPIVLLGEIRHCCRTLLTFTRPYFGTARSMSKTLAVSTYSGGSSRSSWIDTRPPLRSRLSCARRVRIVVRALERVHPLVQGALGRRRGLGGVFVAGGMGGESTQQPACRQASARRIRLHLDLSFRSI